jgi:hypothetical protein
MSPLFSRDRPSKRQIAKQERDQFESLAIKGAHGDAEALQALPAAATQVREFYRNDNQYLDEAWAAMTVALRDVLTDDVLTEQKETHIAQLSFALGIQQWGVDLPNRNFALYEEVMVARINDGRPIQKRQRAPHNAARGDRVFPDLRGRPDEGGC